MPTAAEASLSQVVKLFRLRPVWHERSYDEKKPGSTGLPGNTFNARLSLQSVWVWLPRI
jgi:hypothetical protein